MALNRYMYVLNNPVLYRDTSGHCAEGGALGGPCFDSGNEMQISDKPGTEPPDEELADTLEGLGTVMDVIGWGLSFTGLVMKGAILTAGAAADGPAPVGDVLAILVEEAAYKVVLDPFERASSVGSMAFTIGADIEGGYTYRDKATPSGYTELVIGESTATDLGFNMFNYMCTDALGDTIGNTAEFLTQHYELFNLSDERTWELRVSPIGIYVRCYGNCNNVVMNILPPSVVHQYPN